MLFRHARVFVTELLGNDGHGNASHRKKTPVRVAQDMKRYDWGNLGVFASLGQRSALV